MAYALHIIQNTLYIHRNTAYLASWLDEQGNTVDMPTVCIE